MKRFVLYSMQTLRDMHGPVPSSDKVDHATTRPLSCCMPRAIIYCGASLQTAQSIMLAYIHACHLINFTHAFHYEASRRAVVTFARLTQWLRDTIRCDIDAIFLTCPKTDTHNVMHTYCPVERSECLSVTNSEAIQIRKDNFVMKGRNCQNLFNYFWS